MLMNYNNYIKPYEMKGCIESVALSTFTYPVRWYYYIKAWWEFIGSASAQPYEFRLQENKNQVRNSNLDTILKRRTDISSLYASINLLNWCHIKLSLT